MGSFTTVNSKRKRYKRIMLKMLKRPCNKCFELILEGKKGIWLSLVAPLLDTGSLL
jgi:hypothetical protein